MASNKRGAVFATRTGHFSCGRCIRRSAMLGQALQASWAIRNMQHDFPDPDIFAFDTTPRVAIRVYRARRGRVFELRLRSPGGQGRDYRKGTRYEDVLVNLIKLTCAILYAAACARHSTHHGILVSSHDKFTTTVSQHHHRTATEPPARPT